MYQCWLEIASLLHKLVLVQASNFPVLHNPIHFHPRNKQNQSRLEIAVYIRAVMTCPSIGQKWFWTVQIVLDWYKLFLVRFKSLWLGPNHFGHVQIIFFWTIFYNLNLSKMIWIRPKQIEPIQNNWYSNKIIWMVQNDFGPITYKA